CRTRRSASRSPDKTTAGAPPTSPEAAGIRKRSGSFRSAIPPGMPALLAVVVIQAIVKSLPARRHEPSLRVFDEIVERRHVGDRQPFHSVQKSRLQHICLEERPGWFKDKTSPGDLFAGRQELFG